jgi:hypothetical protein
MTRRVIAVSAIAALGVAAALTPGGSASAADPGGVQLGIVKSLDVTSKGLIVFADAAGAHVQVKSWDPAHPSTPPVVLVGGLPPGSANAATNDHKGIWVVYGGSDPDGPANQGETASAWYIPYKGQPKRVLDVAKFQSTQSPDPYDLEQNPGESNPYDVEVLPDNSALIADAAGNDLLRVTPAGKAWTVACFPDQLESTKGVPPGATGGQTLPAQIPAEAVPTGVALDGHGNAYVSTLTGFPFAYGTARVFRVSVDAKNAGCNGTPTHPVLPGPIAASGFTGIDDVWVGTDGALYVTELDKLGIFNLEGASSPASILGTGRVTRVKGNTRTELAAGTLTAPGAAVLGRDGHVYVTDLSLVGAVLKRIS